MYCFPIFLQRTLYFSSFSFKSKLIDVFIFSFKTLSVDICSPPPTHNFASTNTPQNVKGTVQEANPTEPIPPVLSPNPSSTSDLRARSCDLLCARTRSVANQRKRYMQQEHPCSHKMILDKELDFCWSFFLYLLSYLGYTSNIHYYCWFNRLLASEVSLVLRSPFWQDLSDVQGRHFRNSVPKTSKCSNAPYI